MSWYRPKSFLDRIFQGGILLKGASGLLEFVSGLALFFVSPKAMRDFIAVLTQRELLEDPRDIVANFLVSMSQQFGSGNKAFLIIYLWVHAVIKLIAVIGLLKNKLWAFPFSLITLGLLTLYQLYILLFVKVSAGMLVLTIFDIFILLLIWRECHKTK